MRFDGQIAVITGGASGIGLATAKRLGSEGCCVVIADLDEDRAKKAADAVEDAGSPRAIAAACDVSDEEAVRSVIARCIDTFEKLDVVINNAGLMVFKPIAEHTAEDWLKILRVDLLGAFFFTKHAFLTMKNGGTIVNVASIHAVETTPNVASYAAAKAALVSFTRSSAIEGKPLHIRVNAVLPGAIDTPMLWENPNIKAGLETISTADVGTAEDVAATIAYLASADAAFVQGAAVRVDGGRLNRL